jgi:hypothetical protein
MNLFLDNKLEKLYFMSSAHEAHSFTKFYALTNQSSQIQQLFPQFD